MPVMPHPDAIHCVERLEADKVNLIGAQRRGLRPRTARLYTAKVIDPRATARSAFAVCNI
jgi:hypothetical protein